MNTESNYPTTPELAAEIADELKFNADGLIPAIAQDDTPDGKGGEILMMAWMNKDAVIETLTTGRACYYSRSRQKLWRKGESSGQEQHVKDFRWDCDSDTVVMLVTQKGVACHTGRRNCFFKSVRDGKIETIADVEISPEELYGK